MHLGRTVVWFSLVKHIRKCVGCSMLMRSKRMIYIIHYKVECSM